MSETFDSASPRARGRVSRHVLANLSGQGVTVVIGLAAIPWYLKLLGPEAYGLVGFFIATSAVLNVFDFGITPTVNREVARHSAADRDPGIIRDFVRTVELVYVAIGAAIGLALFFAFPLLGSRWIDTAGLAGSAVVTAFRIMAVLFAVQWPVSFYQGVLFGLERHWTVNAVTIAGAVARSVGAIGVLLLIAPTPLVFFGWQLSIAAVQTGCLAILAWRSLPRTDRPPLFALAQLHGIRLFATGLALTSLLTALLRQADKLVLSRAVSLRLFGYYSVAAIVGGGLALLSAPIFVAAFPRFTGLAERGERRAFVALYHRACQLVTVLTAPIAAVICLYAPQILLVWTGDAEVAAYAAVPAAILTLGTFVNGLVGIPYDIQIANGFTRLGVYKNAVGVAVLVPLTYFLAHRFSLAGAAVSWLLLNLGYLVVEMPIVHRRFLPGEGRAWLLRDTTLPVAAAFAGALIVWPWRSAGMSRSASAVLCVVAGCSAAMACAAATPLARDFAGDFLATFNRRFRAPSRV